MKRIENFLENTKAGQLLFVVFMFMIVYLLLLVS